MEVIMRTAAELLQTIYRGWNLGNEEDCFPFDDAEKIFNERGQHPGAPWHNNETDWGNPIVEEAVIDTIAASGMNLIRIPVTWFGAMTDEAGTIHPDKLKRVKELVDWALDDGMVTIVNMHHENSWMFNRDFSLETVCGIYCNVWRQIAEAFRGYPDMLIFEALNEPRIENAPEEWCGGTAEVRDKVNRLQSAFRDQIRSDPAHQKRILLYTTPGAVPAECALQDLIVPEDPYLGVSTHLYRPSAFCNPTVPEDVPVRWTAEGQQEIDAAFERIDRFLVSKGIPVILTEYGAADHHNEDDVAEWTGYILRKANSLGISGIFWDNNSEEQNGDGFSILRRQDLTWVRPKVRDAILVKDISAGENH